MFFTFNNKGLNFDKALEILCVVYYEYNKCKKFAVLAALFPKDHHVSMLSVVTTGSPLTGRFLLLRLSVLFDSGYSY